ncbi:MAG: protein BatD [Nitrospirae bacterium]|nr:protein BatD [Nitrospirota bacterium]
MTRFWMVLGLLLSWAGPALADVTVSASVRPDRVALGDSVEYAVTVNGESSGIEQPEPPDTPDVEVVASGSSTSFQFINGQVSRSMVFTFSLRPGREGNLTLPPTTVTVKGRKYPTNPVQLTALPASSRYRAQGAPSASPFGVPFGALGANGQGVGAGDVVIDTDVDNPSPYVGEQVILTFTLDRVVNLFQADYTEPEFTGLRSYPLQPPPDGESRTEVRGGRRHVILTRRVALFPVQPGAAGVGPAALDFTVNPFAGGQHLETEPITLQVRPLPAAGRPDGFSGAVGDLRLTATLTPDRVDLGDTATLAVTVSGRGNLQDIAAVTLPDLGDAEVYAPEIVDRFEQGPQGLKGVRELRYILIPRHAGELAVGEVTLPVFDPKAGVYKTLRAGGATLSVTGAAPGAAPTAAAPARRDAAAPEAGHGILPWLEGGFILAALGGLMWFSRRAGRRARAPEPLPPRPPAPGRAETLADLAGLANLARVAGEADGDAWLRALEQAVCAHLAGLWGVAPAQVGEALARERLADRPELAARAADLLGRIGMARYAPGGVAVAREELLAAARALIAELTDKA